MSAAKLLDVVAGLSAVNDADSIIGVAQSLLPEEVIRLVRALSVNHVVQRDSLFYDAEILIAREMIDRPHHFVLDPLRFIFDLIQIAEGASRRPADEQSLTLSLPPTGKKSTVLKKFDEFLQSLTGTAAIREAAVTIADELFTNGVKNAWPEGCNRKLVAPTRIGQVEFFARADGKRLIIGCRDSFGLLGFQKILARIQLCYENGVAPSISQGEGGAGIGSFMVFNSSVSYYAGVNPGSHSVVCVSLPLGISARKLSQLSKNIHLVTVK